MCTLCELLSDCNVDSSIDKHMYFMCYGVTVVLDISTDKHMYYVCYRVTVM